MKTVVYKKIIDEYGSRQKSINALAAEFGISAKMVRVLTLKVKNVSYDDFISTNGVSSVLNIINK